MVTVSPDQHLLVAANEAKEPVEVALPYTIGNVGADPAGRGRAGQGEESPSVYAERTGQGSDPQGFHVEAGEVGFKSLASLWDATLLKE